MDQTSTRTSARPVRWKMALLTWLTLMPITSATAYALQPAHLPLLANVAMSSAVSIALLTWVVMPRLTRRLGPWLRRRGASDARARSVRRSRPGLTANGDHS
ncbi:hypothetical protein [Luteitalea sp. TBR-22]|uniref:hypothetical protein n=1 Tax=Luteitalea sp. TBR-22 TaxID=2802971 RepID=UPI001EF5AC8C|nr:hypothetical protein [Luteitalea sp. TBR-22]